MHSYAHAKSMHASHENRTHRRTSPRWLHATNSTRILSSQTLSLPTHAMPSSSRRRRGPCRRRRKEAAAETRNWADMPLDAILAVFHKLDHIDILMAADQVCSSWRRAARDEPMLWRHIVMRGNADLSSRINRQGIACDAVRRSAGHSAASTPATPGSCCTSASSEHLQTRSRVNST